MLLTELPTCLVYHSDKIKNWGKSSPDMAFRIDTIFPLILWLELRDFSKSKGDIAPFSPP